MHHDLLAKAFPSPNETTTECGIFHVTRSVAGGNCCWRWHTSLLLCSIGSTLVRWCCQRQLLSMWHVSLLKSMLLQPSCGCIFILLSYLLGQAWLPLHIFGDCVLVPWLLSPVLIVDFHCYIHLSDPLMFWFSLLTMNLSHIKASKKLIVSSQEILLVTCIPNVLFWQSPSSTSNLFPWWWRISLHTDHDVSAIPDQIILSIKSSWCSGSPDLLSLAIIDGFDPSLSSLACSLESLSLVITDGSWHENLILIFCSHFCLLHRWHSPHCATLCFWNPFCKILWSFHPVSVSSNILDRGTCDLHFPSSKYILGTICSQ